MKIGGILALTLLAPSLLFGSENAGSKAEKVYDWMCKKPEGYTEEIRGITTIRNILKEEDVSKLDYQWRWDLHNAQIIFVGKNCEKSRAKALYLSVRQYQELSTKHSRQFTEYTLGDWNADGTLEKKIRGFQMLQGDKDGGDVGWFFLSPSYPGGFRNETWNSPSDEEAMKLYNSELDFWVKEGMEKD